MLLHCWLLLICLNYVRTTEDVYDYGLGNSATEWNRKFSYWPSLHNALARLQKRDIPVLGEGLSEGGGVPNGPVPSADPVSLHPAPHSDSNATISGLPNVASTLPAAKQTTQTPSLQPSASNNVPKEPKPELSRPSKGIYLFLL